MGPILIYLFLYVLVFFILILPEKFFEKHLELLKKTISKCLIFYEESSTKFSLVFRANLLIEYIYQLEIFFLKSKFEKTYSVPKYKFYTKIVNVLLNVAKTYGSPIKESLSELRHGIVKDLEFERKLRQENISGVVQFITIAFVTWFFVLCVYKYLAIKVDGIFLIVITVLHFSGIIIYYIVNKKIKKNIFIIFESLFYNLYALRAYQNVSMPINQIMTNIDLNFDKYYGYGKFSFIIKRINFMIDNWQKSGIAIKSEIDLIIEEISIIQIQTFDIFVKKTQVLKFAILALFYLTAYLVFLLGLIRSFLFEY